MKPTPQFIVRTDNSIRKSPEYHEFETREEAEKFLEFYWNDASLDGSGDIGFEAALYTEGV